MAVVGVVTAMGLPLTMERPVLTVDQVVEVAQEELLGVLLELEIPHQQLRRKELMVEQGE
jgi:hypothetical protein